MPKATSIELRIDEPPERVPRPGVEPGLEVPETSVMSFSLPGRQRAGLYQPCLLNKPLQLLLVEKIEDAGPNPCT